MLDGFKKFIARGNAVDLAVGVVMGAAFGAIVTGLVDGFINPLIAWIAGKPNFDDLVFTLSPLFGNAEPTTFFYGKIITAVVNFLLVAIAIYFFVVIPINKFNEKIKKKEEAAPAAPSEEILLLREIRDSLAIRRAVANKQNPKS